MPEPLDQLYDRQAASRILARIASAGLFPPTQSRPIPRQRAAGMHIRYTAAPMRTEPGSHLTGVQLEYLRSSMRPCQPEQVTSATHRIGWDDSEGMPNAGHIGPSALGPIVPIAARETVLALWRQLPTSPAMTGPATALDDHERAILAATTTDGHPLEIFRIGIEATAKALAQHALIADQTPHSTPEAFAHAMCDSGVFLTVASHWFWELQAATYRRGMIPVRFTNAPDGALRYAPDSLAILRAMKEQTIARAREVMARATGAEGLTAPQAIQKYHHDLDLISQQYALLPIGEQPRCLAAMTHQLDAGRFSVLPVVVDRFVTTFIAIAHDLSISPADDGAPTGVITDPVERIFQVPDMSCSHCVSTISGILRSMDIEVLEADLAGKRFVADFHTRDARERAFDAIRGSGYTVVPPRPA